MTLEIIFMGIATVGILYEAYTGNYIASMWAAIALIWCVMSIL